MELSLEDVLKLTPDKLLDKLVVPEPVTDKKTQIQQVKSKLKGYFKDDPSLILTGHIFKLDATYVMISTVIRSTGRVFFTILGDNFKFSVPKNFLLDESPEELPYKINELVKYEGEEWKVTSVNPASRTVRLTKGDKNFSINIDKLRFANRKENI